MRVCEENQSEGEEEVEVTMGEAEPVPDILRVSASIIGERIRKFRQGRPRTGL